MVNVLLVTQLSIPYKLLLIIISTDDVDDDYCCS